MPGVLVLGKRGEAADGVVHAPADAEVRTVHVAVRDAGGMRRVPVGDVVVGESDEVRLHVAQHHVVTARGDVKLLDWVDARQQILDELNQARSV